MNNEDIPPPPPPPLDADLILDLLDNFSHAREALVQGLKKRGFSDEQAHAKIMRHQQETQQMYRDFQRTIDQHPDYSRRKVTITSKDLDTYA